MIFKKRNQLQSSETDPINPGDFVLKKIDFELSSFISVDELHDITIPYFEFTV